MRKIQWEEGIHGYIAVSEVGRMAIGSSRSVFPAFVTHATPSAAALLGSTAALLEPLIIVAAVFVLGFYVFNRTAPHVAEDL